MRDAERCMNTAFANAITVAFTRFEWRLALKHHIFASHFHLSSGGEGRA
jgi:hypothetical protein